METSYGARITATWEVLGLDVEERAEWTILALRERAARLTATYEHPGAPLTDDEADAWNNMTDWLDTHGYAGTFLDPRVEDSYV